MLWGPQGGKLSKHKAANTRSEWVSNTLSRSPPLSLNMGALVTPVCSQKCSASSDHFAALKSTRQKSTRPWDTGLDFEGRKKYKEKLKESTEWSWCIWIWALSFGASVSSAAVSPANGDKWSSTRWPLELWHLSTRGSSPQLGPGIWKCPQCNTGSSQNWRSKIQENQPVRQVRLKV